VQEQFARCRQIVSPSHADRGYRLRVTAGNQIWALRNLRLRAGQLAYALGKILTRIYGSVDHRDIDSGMLAPAVDGCSKRCK
jgi:hypothetical protein